MWLAAATVMTLVELYKNSVSLMLDVMSYL